MQHRICIHTNETIKHTVQYNEHRGKINDHQVSQLMTDKAETVYIILYYLIHG